jgi:thiazole synthase ThiGH ThiG subunit
MRIVHQHSARAHLATQSYLQEVIQAGADGVAVISAVCAAADPKAAAARFLTQIRAARNLTAARRTL